MKRPRSARPALLAALALALAIVVPTAAGGPPPPLDDGVSGDRSSTDPSAALEEQDEATADVVSSGPFAKVIKNLAVAGRGARVLPNATTDVWAHGRYAYIGTFNSPCGTGEGFGQNRLVQGVTKPGVVVFDVRNRHKVSYVGNLPSVEGSRINDVKVAKMNSGTILVHSNEACAGGPGGFEVYEVSNPRRPVHLASVRVDDPNAVLRDEFGDADVGVHNLFLFTQGRRDYVAMQTHAVFGSFQIYELTNPRNPRFVSAWGAEFLCEEDFCTTDPYNETDVGVILDTIFDWLFDGFGNSRNRLLHDVTVSDDGTKAYLSNWDAGLVLLDISNPAAPRLVSVALAPERGSLDGEVNSHAAWPTADGKVVVETEEDFSVFETIQPLGNFTFQEHETNTIPGVGVSTRAGNDFQANQTGNNVTVTATEVRVNSGPLAGNTYAAEEGAGNQPKLADTGPITGEAVWIGRACDGDPILNAAAIDPGDVAIARRGACFFWEKLKNAAAAGAAAIVIANNAPVDTVWGGVRIWDYSDPANPKLASTFNTVCSANPSAPSCDPRGTYSVHNVIVEKRKAYFSWYSDGVLILDISNPYRPVETARWHQAGPAFEARNGGIQDVWGIYKQKGPPWLYASDRNGGLYVLKEYGKGTIGKKGMLGTTGKKGKK